ncbi:carbohydrate-binding family 9-like protein [Fodinibius saliphilus]|uniref:carbohydrate-binding family 9-like protein n=1 Tax=Fodinibius saliphilus TaxID=1920650 RepID=UPI001107E155|nr:carbohydrate-binding family 9-like protein [Fodinibius saliphilus]
MKVNIPATKKMNVILKSDSIVAFVILLFLFVEIGKAQNEAPAIKFNPKTYVAPKVSNPLTIDGSLNENGWQRTIWTDPFLDIEGESASKPRYRTTVKMLWDDTYLYIAAQLEEPHVWARLKERDAVIFHDNNFEVFVDPDGDTHQYYELEVNALGTFWDLMLTEPYRTGGKAIDSWDMRDLKIGIDIQGTLNNPADIDSGWTVELAIPWKDLEEASKDGNRPSVGDQWRINFSRVEWKLESEEGAYRKVTDPDTNEPLSEDNWVWSPQGVVNMHYPEMWGYIQFAKEVGDSSSLDKEENIKWYLRRLYYQQYRYKKNKGSFTSDPQHLKSQFIADELGLTKQFPDFSIVAINSSIHTFEIQIKEPESGKRWYIRENGRVWSTAL